MDKLVIIRTCPKDDYIARLCYESFLYHNVQAEYLFMAENGKYIWISQTGQPIHYREFCDNFWGQSGAKGYIKALKDLNIDTSKYDFICVCDSDIILKTNVFKMVGDGDGQLGTGGYVGSLFHLSGQLNIYSRNVFNHILAITENYIEANMHKLHSIADDSFISMETDRLGVKKIAVFDKWVHEKVFKSDFKSIIQSYQ